MPTRLPRLTGAPDSLGSNLKLVFSLGLSLGLVLSVPTASEAQAPLSAIEWLNRTPQEVAIPPTVLVEPPVAQSATGPKITVTPLEQQMPSLGLVSPAVTGLPTNLWQASAPERVAQLLRDTPVAGQPVMQSLLMTLLLTEARSPAGDQDALLLARLDRLLDLGATDPTQALVQEADPGASRARFARWFDATLLTGDESRSCAMLTARPYLDPDYRARIFCAVRRGDWPMAALIMETALALEVFAPEDAQLLDRFLNPDLFEGAPHLPFPADPDPLTLRLFETIGEPLPTSRLPRAFATADLRDVAGWKAQLEAAERLTRSGAMNPNQLLGLFTQRRAAASGAIWDRVEAVQSMERAILDRDLDAIATALPPLWTAATEAGIEQAVSDLFAPAVKDLPLSGEAAIIAWHMQLQSEAYETATPPAAAKDAGFLTALAKGMPEQADSKSPWQKAITRGFDKDAPLPPAQTLLLSEGRLGEAILVTMESFHHGAAGNLAALSQSLLAFRLMGLEDTARRASLQLLLKQG